MSQYIPSVIKQYYQLCTDYSQEILDPTLKLKTELQAKNLFWTSFVLFFVVGYSLLTVSILSFTDQAIFSWCMVVCFFSVVCLRYKKIRYLPLVLSVEIFFNNFALALVSNNNFFGNWGLTLVVPNFYMFLTQSKAMAFLGFLTSCLFNAVIGPRFRGTLMEEAASTKLVDIFDVGVSYFTTFAFYNFAFCAMSAMQTEQILQTWSQTLEEEQNMKQEKELLNSKTLFFSCFSHEMRNPLNCILGSMDYVLKYASDEVTRDILVTGKACGNMLLNLINNILDMGKIDSNNICLNEDTKDSKVFITNVWRVTQELFKKKKQQGEFFVDRGFPANIVIDDARLSQVVVNLVSNACKFSEEGQIIRVVFSFEPEDPTMAPRSPIPSCLLNPVPSPYCSLKDLTSKNDMMSVESMKRNASLKIPQNFSIFRRNARPMRSIEEEQVDQNQMGQVSRVKTKKTLENVMSQSQTLCERFVLLFTSYRSDSHNIEWNPKTHHALVGQRGFIKIDVTDSGCGMTSDEIGKLFKPFEQGNKTIYGTYGGTGLGLYITQSLVHLMKGAIAVESLPGGGSTFSVSIPNVLPEGSSGCGLRLSSVVMKTNSPNSRVKIVVYGGDKVAAEKGELKLFVEKAILSEFSVEKSNKFLIPDSIQISSNYAGIIFIYDLACLTQKQLLDLQSSSIDSPRQKIIFCCSSDLTQHKKDLPASVTIFRDSEGLFSAVQVHTKQLLHFIKSKNTLLIVDDDDFNRKIMTVFLSKEGYKILTANNGQVGFEVFCQNAQDIKMVIVDYEMPICDGPTCTEMILKYAREQGLPLVPIYCLTGNVSAESKTRLTEAGIRKTWNKPAKMEEVVSEVFYTLLNVKERSTYIQ